MGITDKNKEAIINLKVILSEITECEESICYVTDIDAEPLRLAIKALEKQIPKKPIINKRKIQCVNGHNQPVQHYKYCPMCGQLMDWSDEE